MPGLMVDDTHTAAAVLEAAHIAKTYPGVKALDDVGISLRAGEVVGVVGENGSGKSTLLKILAGREAPDEGAVDVDGHRVVFRAPAEALRHGIALIAQEVHVQDDLTVAENLLEGRLPRRALGLIDWPAANARAREVLERVGLGHIPPRLPARALALHDQQMLAIAKVVHRQPRVALFDEPTSSLTPAEVARLYTMIEHLKRNGTAIVYITHRLHEYFDLTDRLIVLRDGRLVAEHHTNELDEARLVQLMVGRKLEQLFKRSEGTRTRSESTVLEVKGLTTRTLRGVDLEVAAGEIVGVAGQAGSGRSSLAGTLFGRWPYSGQIRLGGDRVALTSPAAAIRHGIALVPEDRKREGLVGTMSVGENLGMPSWSSTSRGGTRRPGVDRARAQALRARFGIRAAGLDAPVASLSGGNQQKVVIAKWTPREVKVLILDEPTRGVDVGAKAEIYALIEELAASGVAVIVLSSELLEIMRLADRIVVMARGALVGEIDGAEATEESITAMAFAGAAAEAAA
jgi:ABC-type sugar transport system ATPase subunit